MELNDLRRRVSSLMVKPIDILRDDAFQFVELFQFRDGEMNPVWSGFLEAPIDFGTHDPVLLPGFLARQESLEVKILRVVLVPNSPRTSKIRNPRLGACTRPREDHDPVRAHDEFRNGFDFPYPFTEMLWTMSNHCRVLFAHCSKVSLT